MLNYFYMLNKSTSLFDLHKAERRARILASARRLIARRGVEGLTLRDLAAASQVSVPTVYNLIGGKQALLSALLEETFARVAARLGALAEGGLVARALALCEAGWSELLAEPAYFRELVHAFLVSDETTPLRRQIDERQMDVMTQVLRIGQAHGELAEWADPAQVASTLYAHYVLTLLRWAGGELQDPGLAPTITYGLCLILLGVARGEAAHELERRCRQAQSQLPKPDAAAAGKGASR